MEPGSRKGAEISADLDVLQAVLGVFQLAALGGGVNEAPVPGALPYQPVFGPSCMNSGFFLLNIWSGLFIYPPPSAEQGS